MIEFAFALPLFLTLVLGVLYYGIGFATQQAVNYAAGRAAETAVAVDPELAPAVFLDTVRDRAERRVAAVLSYFPGVAGRQRFVLSGSCDAARANAGDSSLCIDPDIDEPGRRVVTVNLAPTFQSLWPGFPDIGLVPTPGVVAATGTAVVAGSSVADEAG